MNTWTYPVALPVSPSFAYLKKLAKKFRKAVDQKEPSALQLLDTLGIPHQKTRFSLTRARHTVARACCVPAWERLEEIAVDPFPEVVFKTPDELSSPLLAVVELTPGNLQEKLAELAQDLHICEENANRLLVRLIGYREFGSSETFGEWFSDKVYIIPPPIDPPARKKAPDEIVSGAGFLGYGSREVTLTKGERYRVEPLNPQKLKHRGEEGELRGFRWDYKQIFVNSAILKTDDGRRLIVDTGDLVKLSYPQRSEVALSPLKQADAIAAKWKSGHHDDDPTVALFLAPIWTKARDVNPGQTDFKAVRARFVVLLFRELNTETPTKEQEDRYGKAVRRLLGRGISLTALSKIIWGNAGIRAAKELNSI